MKRLIATCLLFGLILSASSSAFAQGRWGRGGPGLADRIQKMKSQVAATAEKRGQQRKRPFIPPNPGPPVRGGKPGTRPVYTIPSQDFLKGKQKPSDRPRRGWPRPVVKPPVRKPIQGRPVIVKPRPVKPPVHRPIPSVREGTR